MKKSIIILFFLLLNFLHFNIAFTDGLTLGGYQSIAPISIPQGINKVGMTEIKFRSGGNGDTTSISQITVKLTGTVLPDDIINVYVFFDGGNKSYDGGSIDDIDAIESGGPVQFDGSNSIIVDIDPAIVQFGWGGWSYLYIAFDISSNADFLKTVGCEVDNIVYGDPPDGTGGTGSPLILSPHGVTENIDSYEVTLDVLGIAPAQAEQGENDIKILKLTFTSLDADASTYMDSIRLHRVGTGSDADIATGGVSLYDDSGTVKGELDPGDQVIASGSISGGYVLLDPTTDIQITSAGNDIFFVTLNISLTATVGNTVGLEVEDPSTDVVFIDVISDLYTQLGYIVSNTPTPGLGNTLEIIQATILDTTPPEVAYTNPSNQETGVSLTTSVTVVFSESIDPSTVTTTTFFIKDSNNNLINGTVSASGSSASFIPYSKLQYETTYTATVTTGITDIAGNNLTQNYTWQFTTLEYVPEPVVGNNMITPGSSDPVQIHIPTPPGGQSARITVEVYTVTGERIAVLVNNRPYSEIVSSLPILWYGKNGRQQKLGPGLYFIQIRSKNYKKVLKVLIVR